MPFPVPISLYRVLYSPKLILVFFADTSHKCPVKRLWLFSTTAENENGSSQLEPSTKKATLFEIGRVAQNIILYQKGNVLDFCDLGSILKDACEKNYG